MRKEWPVNYRGSADLARTGDVLRAVLHRNNQPPCIVRRHHALPGLVLDGNIGGGIGSAAPVWTPALVESYVAASRRGDVSTSGIMKTSWAAMLEGAGRSQLETAFVPAFLARQRWFGGKTRRIRATRIVDWGELPLSTAVLALLEVTYDTGEPDAYLVFLATTYLPEADRLRQEFPYPIVCS